VKFLKMFGILFVLLCLVLPVSAEEPKTGSPETLKNDAPVVVYYFHGKRRCVTCQKLEAYAKETLDNNFADALKSGKIEWRVLDISTPENIHFVEDFGLVSQSLVLVREKDGKPDVWKNLDQIWQKVHNETDYMDYVAESIKAFMGQG